ncbi:lysophospholipid acyltransferase family protein [Pedobacter panaciterrae]|jgi:Lauroyl/myristoyl acyltransferase|uniref:lysophospholipid acyltransferase family protein n=1 Tax=Pedobacter panaciterrae TaxID=363849 RepID=UPI00155DBA78|nr:lysophospholipid acyltransferase family protein [Pedobacter panaciterrae]NQX53293.1 lysophospholipid acyltransferase family protein [Pedobacter panaciterrae]
MFKKSISHLGTFFLAVLSLLPLSFLYIWADAAYFLLYYVFGYRRQVVRENLCNSFPEKELKEIIVIEKKYYRYLSSLIFEVIKMINISEAQIRKRFVFKNKELVNEYLNKGESVLVCSAHYGNWEWGTLGIGLNFSADHYPIYKPLNNSIFDKWFRETRSKFGNKLIPMRQTLRAIQASKNTPSIFSFGNDQSPSIRELHYCRTFLNQPAYIQLGIEKIAKKTNRPIFYLRVKVLKRGHYEVDCVPLCLNPMDTEEFEITRLHTQFLEEIIKDEPAYWLWSHRRWKHKPVQMPEPSLKTDILYSDV